MPIKIIIIPATITIIILEKCIVIKKEQNNTFTEVKLPAAVWEGDTRWQYCTIYSACQILSIIISCGEKCCC